MESYKRFIETENDKVHLGLEYYVHRDIWERLKREQDSKFIKDLSSIFWGPEVLKLRCLDKKKIKEGRDSAERKELSPEKYKLLEDLLYKKLTESKCTGAPREARMKLIGHFLSQKIRDCRKNLKF
ncbi:uncharacterized protein LOC127279697 [Leptopilina boulardi]|uniref:uncharacterized protein LOC127279697 n=1 Tax=Leptopilina boulardi TaxID=63433 RepID=UPI0021F5AC39|nr:uncharacterized protein LOC127279697 [Leptopilina boulardi]